MILAVSDWRARRGDAESHPRLSGFRFRFPQIFPLSTNRDRVGHAGKFCNAAFCKITHSADAHPHVISKSDNNRCHKLDRPAIVHGDQIHSWGDDSTHCASLNSVGLDSYDSVAFAGSSSELAGMLGVSSLAGDSWTLTCESSQVSLTRPRQTTKTKPTTMNSEARKCMFYLQRRWFSLGTPNDKAEPHRHSEKNASIALERNCFFLAPFAVQLIGVLAVSVDVLTCCGRRPHARSIVEEVTCRWSYSISPGI
jgi:hypothetical protein